MGAAQKRNSIEDMLLEPFQPQVNDRRNKERDHLRNDQSSDNDKAKRPARGSITSEADGEGKRAHESGKRGHHDRTKTFHAGFVNGGAQVPAFVDALQSKIY